ncbi:non-canonical purine NTP diphosphatase [Maribacter sp. PR1]|uniref:dITP/XTP pyrophosphatase n=1 Tax=Maribacter cobaltidurans TaxID=1178778 RepID=A0ABU7IV86_9FLAO|nr:MULTISPECIES: non-canonical purine NTP diphosphatase [Maribacter]MDC6389521.1 non-canonical purine NTP diphosphatase [Maribacter sp. PR1]MEE1976910.1 non-canonical purine NTP diphosphatase [Maribacter cobaltidurans]
MKLVFATQNQNKLREIKKLLPPNIDLVSLNEIGCTESIPETAETLQGNAKLKSDYVYQKYKLPCFADDSGLVVDSLNGEPGVYSARYAGKENDAQANMDKLLKSLETKKDRSASFKTVIALNLNGETQFFKGSVQGKITHTKKGIQGFGYDPIFLPNGYTETFAELPIETKNEIGHRGKAFSKLITYLQSNHVTI